MIPCVNLCATTVRWWYGSFSSLRWCLNWVAILTTVGHTYKPYHRRSVGPTCLRTNLTGRKTLIYMWCFMIRHRIKDFRRFESWFDELLIVLKIFSKDRGANSELARSFVLFLLQPPDIFWRLSWATISETFGWAVLALRYQPLIVELHHHRTERFCT